MPILALPADTAPKGPPDHQHLQHGIHSPALKRYRDAAQWFAMHSSVAAVLIDHYLASGAEVTREIAMADLYHHIAAQQTPGANWRGAEGFAHRWRWPVRTTYRFLQAQLGPQWHDGTITGRPYGDRGISSEGGSVAKVGRKLAKVGRINGEIEPDSGGSGRTLAKVGRTLARPDAIYPARAIDVELELEEEERRAHANACPPPVALCGPDPDMAPGATATGSPPASNAPPAAPERRGRKQRSAYAPPDVETCLAAMLIPSEYDRPDILEALRERIALRSDVIARADPARKVPKGKTWPEFFQRWLRQYTNPDGARYLPPGRFLEECDRANLHGWDDIHADERRAPARSHTGARMPAGMTNGVPFVPM